MKPNIRKLRDAWLIAWRAWWNAVAEMGLDPYSDEAEGKLVGRGKAKKPDALRELFDEMERARLEYLDGRAPHDAAFQQAVDVLNMPKDKRQRFAKHVDDYRKKLGLDDV